jgi:hypothetical protein
MYRARQNIISNRRHDRPDWRTESGGPKSNTRVRIRHQQCGGATHPASADVTALAICGVRLLRRYRTIDKAPFVHSSANGHNHHCGGLCRHIHPVTSSDIYVQQTIRCDFAELRQASGHIPKEILLHTLPQLAWEECAGRIPSWFGGERKHSPGIWILHNWETAEWTVLLGK